MATCLHCSKPCRLTTGKEVSKAAHQADKPVWICDACHAIVACYPESTEPLGQAANAKTRQARFILLSETIDPIWQREAEKVRLETRTLLYRFLAWSLKKEPDDCFVSAFTIEECREAWKVLRGVTRETLLRFELDRGRAKTEGAAQPEKRMSEYERSRQRARSMPLRR